MAEAWLLDLVLAAVSAPSYLRSSCLRWAARCLAEELKLLVQPHSQMGLHLTVMEQACWFLAGMQPLPVLLKLGWEVDWESD